MKYIFYCGPGIGDVIMMLPIAKAIKEKDADSQIMLFSMMSNKLNFGRRDAVQTILEAQHLIDGIGYYCIREPFKTLKWLLNLGFKNFDYGFVQQADAGKNISPWPCKIIKFLSKTTLGTVYEDNNQISYDINLNYNKISGSINRYMHLLNTIGISHASCYENLLDYNIIQQRSKVIHNKIDGSRKNVALCLGSAPLSRSINGKKIKKFTKNWSYQNWVKLADAFVKCGYEVFLIGGSQERKEFIQMCPDATDVRIHNFAGRCSVLESIWILYQCKIVIGADTGMMHCAAAIGVPGLTLFGCTSPREFLAYGPKSFCIVSNEVCSPCYQTDRMVLCDDVKCMNNILVQDVLEKSIRIIDSYDKDIS